MFLSSDTGMSGNFVSCIKDVRYRFVFQEGTWDLSRDAAVGKGSSRDDGGTLWFFSSSGGNLELQQGTQEAPRVAPGKSNILTSCKGELGIAIESVQGK